MSTKSLFHAVALPAVLPALIDAASVDPQTVDLVPSHVREAPGMTGRPTLPLLQTVEPDDRKGGSGSSSGGGSAPAANLPMPFVENPPELKKPEGGSAPTMVSPAKLPPGAQTMKVVVQPFEFRVGVQTRRIPLRVVSGLLRGAFNGTAVHINNYNPATGRVRENDSFVRLSEDLGGLEMRFNILPAETGPRRYYINDINLASVHVSPVGHELRVRMTFEDAGTEFIGTCGQDGFDAGCIAGAPDVQASIVVDIFSTLERYYSRSAPVSLGFGGVRVVATPNAQADGLCLAFDFPCTLVNDYHALIKDIIEVNFTAALDTTRVRDDVANALLPALRDLRIGTVQSVRIEGTNLVLTYLDNV